MKLMDAKKRYPATLLVLLALVAVIIAINHYEKHRYISANAKVLNSTWEVTGLQSTLYKGTMPSYGTHLVLSYRVNGEDVLAEVKIHGRQIYNFGDVVKVYVLKAKPEQCVVVE